MGDPAAHPYRLGDEVLPRTYRLILEPDLDGAVFAGEVEIDVDIIEGVDRIALNALDLEITRAEVTVDGTTLPLDVELDAAAERALLSPPAPLEPGQATLSLSFTGVLNDQLVGFYRSTFTDADGVTHAIATTQMEATDARRAFPCFDEPAKKASFEISLVVPEGLAAYSNSPVVSEEPTGRGSRLVRFSPTMVMSTYLVAFVVGPFEATDALDVDGVPVRIVYPPGKEQLAPFALEVAAHSLRYFTDYFGIPYPGEKLDLLAIPDFAFGAMENLGCVTFRETALLVDPEKASRLEVERVVDVVAHEIAHMWFGDLVTMGWWEGIWLNEAFATFMEIKCTDSFRPQWRRWDSFGTSRQAAMAIDGLHSTRPIEFVVESPADARGMFDLLTYEKGGSVLRMLEQHLGEDVFRDGIRRYLNAHAYGNTVTADLWAALEEASGQPVGRIMDSWILQGGHPIVTVADGELRQAPFAYGESADESAIGERWLIPLMTRPLGGGGVERSVLEAGSAAIAPATLVNAGGWGVYRTAYGPDELAAVIGALGSLTPLERATLVADTWAAALSGRSDLGRFLALAAGLGEEIEPATWAVVSSALSTVDAVMDESSRPALAAATRRLYGPLLDRLGWEASPGEDEQTPTLRAMAVAALGGLGQDEAVRAEARRRFDAGDPEGDLANAILSTIASMADPNDFATIRARYAAATSPQAEQRNLMAMAAFASVDLSLEAFAMSLTDEVRNQDAPYFVARLLANHSSGPAVFAALEGSWDAVVERFPQDAHSRMLSGISQQSRDRAHAERVAAFVETHPVRSGQRTVTQEVERMMVAVSFGERERPMLDATLGG